jgi:hypothetical protein
VAAVTRWRDAPPEVETQLPPADPLWLRLRWWLARSPAERVPLVAVPGLWITGDVLHAARAPGGWVAAVAVVAVPVAWAVGERRRRDLAVPHLSATETATLTAVCGAWTAAAAVWGPHSAPDAWLSVVYAMAAVAGYVWLQCHEVARAARARRKDDAEAAARRVKWEAQLAAWCEEAAAVGLGGSHLIKQDDTHLGDARLVDVRDTGRRASTLVGRDLEERVAEFERLSPGQVRTSVDITAGYLWITVRRINPWKDPVMHPYATGELDAASEHARHVPVPATIRDPLAIGVDPETGDPLQVPLWDREGAKVVQVSAMKSGGKTMLFDDLCERITACPDAVLLQVNLSKALEDGWWARLAAASALGDSEVRKARLILKFALGVVQQRPNSGRSTRVHQPTPEEPLYVLKIDEYDKVTNDGQCKQLLGDIESTCRSEGVAVLKAGQRATAAKSGGADNRSQTTVAVWGKFGRGGELSHVAGYDADLPDMGAYGGGAAGVFGVAPLPYQGEYSCGRTFYWGEDSPGLLALVAARAAERAPHRLERALAALESLWAQITGPDDGGLAEPEPGPDDDGGIAGVTARIAATRRLLDDGPEPVAAAEVVNGCLPREQADSLYDLLNDSPDGISVRAAATAAGIPPTTMHRHLSQWRDEGILEVRGKGRAARFFLTFSTGDAGAGEKPPVLRLVPPPTDGDGQ